MTMTRIRLRVDRRAGRVSALVVAALTTGAVALPVGSASAAPRPMTLLVSATINQALGSSAGVYAGAKSAATAINRAKKLNIKLVLCDNKGTVAGGSACTKQAVDSNAVGLIGSDPFLSSGLGEASLKAKSIPFSIFGVGVDDYNGKHVTEFPLTGGGFTPYMGIGAVAKKVGAKKLGIICTEFPGFDTVCENIKRVAEKNGVAVVAETSVSLTSTTFTAQVQKLKSAGADSVAVATGGPFGTPIVQAANAINFKPKWLVLSAAFPDPSLFVPMAKAAGNDLWALSALPPSAAAKNYPGLKQYAAANRGIKPINQTETSIVTWAAVYGYAQIAQKYVKGTITPEKMLAAMKKARNIRIGKGLVTWSPGKKGKAPYPRLSNDLVYYGRVKTDGKYIPNPKQPIHATAGVTLK